MKKLKRKIRKKREQRWLLDMMMPVVTMRVTMMEMGKADMQAFQLHQQKYTTFPGSMHTAGYYLRKFNADVRMEGGLLAGIYEAEYVGQTASLTSEVWRLWTSLPFI